MPVPVYIPTALRQFTGGKSEVNVEAKTAGEAIEQLTVQFAILRKHLYNDQNVLRSFVNVYVNDEDIRHQAGLQTPLVAGSTVTIVPSIAGGVVYE